MGVVVGWGVARWGVGWGGMDHSVIKNHSKITSGFLGVPSMSVSGSKKSRLKRGVGLGWGGVGWGGWVVSGGSFTCFYEVLG